MESVVPAGCVMWWGWFRCLMKILTALGTGKYGSLHLPVVLYQSASYYKPCLLSECSILPSAHACHLPMSRAQHFKQRCPDLPLPSPLLQLFQTQAFTIQLIHVVSPECPGSPSGSCPGGDTPKTPDNLNQLLSKYGSSSSFLSSILSPTQITSKGEPPPFGGRSFSLLVSRNLFFRSLRRAGGKSTDLLSCSPPSLPQRSGLNHCRSCTNPSINLVLYFPFTHDDE